MLMDVLYILLGLVLLFAGGELLIRGAVAIAVALGLSTLLVSTVIVGFGTSTPELVVSVNSALAGSPAIALGNVVGSNIANILLILGVSAIIMPICCENRKMLRDATAVLVASLFLAALSMFSPVNVFVGASLFSLLVGYLGFCIWREKQTQASGRTQSDTAPKSFSASI